MALSEGDFVECVEGYRKGKLQLVESSLYCVESINPAKIDCSLHGDGKGCFGVRTTTPVLGKGLWWCGKRFKPVYKRNHDLFNHLLEQIDEPVSEDA